jgi:uncharacterized delta-60 repeat protein
VTNALELPDGSMLLTGGFNQIGGVPTTGSLTRILPSGVVDSAFAENLPESQGTLRKVALGPDGKIYLTYDGGIDRLNLDGTPDTAFRANVLGSFQPNGTFRKIVFGPNGELYLAGRFQLPLGFRNLLKLNPNGTLDPTWQFTNGNTTFSNSEIQPDGKLIVPGTSSGQLIRILSNGATDASFTPINGVWNQTYGVAADGSIYAAIGSGSNTDLRRYLPDGTLDAAFNGGLDVSLNNSISSIDALPDGSVSIDGSFTIFNGASAPRPYVIKAEKAGIEITGQPIDQIVDPASDVTLQVVAESANTLTYQWFKDGNVLPGKTFPSLQLNAVTVADSANYRVSISDGTRTVSSATAVLIVRDSPVILDTPEDAELLLGDALTLAVDWAGLAPATFEWFRNGSLVPGQSTATLSIPTPTESDSGVYTLQITNGLGQATSSPIVVNIAANPAALASGFVAPTGSSSPFVKNILPEPGGAYVFFTGGITHPSGGYNFVLERIDSSGSIRTPFDSNPNNQVTGIVRDSANGDLYLFDDNFFVDGMGSYRGARIAADGTLDATYTANATAALAGLSVSPYGGALDADGRLIIGGTSRLVRLNADGTLHANLSAGVTGLNFIQKIEVLGDGKILVLGNQGLRRLFANGSIDTTFSMPAAILATVPGIIEIEADGNILLMGNDATGSAIFRLSPDGLLLDTIPLPYATYGFLTNLKVTPSGKLLLAHSFGQRLTRLLPGGTVDPAFSLNAGFNGSVNALAIGEDGSYWAGGSFTTFESSNARALVRLNGEPLDVTIAQQPAAQSTDAGEITQFTVSATAAGGASLSYLWRKDGQALVDGGAISGAGTATLSIANTQLADAGDYDVIVTNLATGRPLASNGASLTVLREPEFLATPSAQTLEVGETLSLSVDVRGAGALGYQWLRNGETIFGANAATLEISPAVESDSAVYSVEITNAYGTFPSIDIPVTVEVPAGGVRYTTPQVTFGNLVSVILPLPDGRTLVGGSFTNVIANSTNYGIGGLALLDANGDLVTDFNLNTSSVEALALMPDGGVLVGGNFTFIDGVFRSRLARLSPDLSLDTDWTPGTGANNRIFSIVASASGYYLGGQFTSYNGDTSLANVCRILPDGAPDPTFTPHAPLGIVYTLRPDGDGVVIGGSLSVANAETGTNQLGLIRLNGDGSHDTSFVASFTSTTTVYALTDLPDGKWLAGGSSGRLQRFLADGTTDNTWGASANNTIRSIIVQRDGRIVIGGNFTTLAGSSINRIGRLNANGAYDGSFVPGDGADGEVYTVSQDALGGLYIGGNFNNYRSLQRGRYARLNGTPTTVGIASDPVTQVVNPGASAEFSVLGLATDTISYQWRRNGVALVNGGDISGANTATLTIANAEETDEASYDVILTNNGDANTVTSAAAELIVLGAPELLSEPVAVTTETGLSATFRVVARGVDPLSYQWYRGTTPLADGPGIAGATTSELVLSDLAVSDSGSIKVRVTNPIDFIESAPVALIVERLAAARDRSIVLPVNVTSAILDVLPFDDGSYLIGGQFTTVSHTNGGGTRRYLAKLNADGSLDSSVPQGSGSGSVEVLARAPDGKIYFGGTFTALSTTGGTVTRTRIARLNSDHSFDASFAVEGNGPNSTVKAIVPLANGQVLIGGQFNNVNSVAGTAYVALLNANGTVDTSFTSQATTTVNDIAPAGDGTYWLSHSNSYGGQSRIVRIDSTGAIASGFSYTDSRSSAGVSLQPDGTVLSFGNNFVQKIEADGTVVFGWAGSGTYLTVTSPSAIAPLADGRFYLGGNFTSIFTDGSSLTRNRIAALDADGSFIDAFDPGEGANSAPNKIRVDSAGRVWLVGGFTSYRGETVPRMVVLNGLEMNSGDPFTDFLIDAEVPEGQRGLDDDPDGDGIRNLVEWIYGLAPNTVDTDFEIFSDLVAGDGASLNTLTGTSDFNAAEEYFTFSMLVPDDSLGASLTVQTASDLTDFDTSPLGVVQIGAPAPAGSGFSRINYAFTSPISSADKGFVRLKIEL